MERERPYWGRYSKICYPKWCLFFFIMHGTLIHLCEPKEKTQRALAYVCVGGHAYSLKSARTVSQREVRDEFRTDVKVMMKSERKSVSPPIEEWKRWGGTCKVPYFYTHQCLSQTWRQLLEQGRSCKLAIEDLQGIIGALKYMCVAKSDAGESGMCVFRRLPAEKQSRVRWLKELGA